MEYCSDGVSAPEPVARQDSFSGTFNNSARSTFTLTSCAPVRAPVRPCALCQTLSASGACQFAQLALIDPYCLGVSSHFALELRPHLPSSRFARAPVLLKNSRPSFPRTLGAHAGATCALALCPGSARSFRALARALRAPCELAPELRVLSPEPALRQSSTRSACSPRELPPSYACSRALPELGELV